MASDQDLENEWARANKTGRAVNRKKAFASLASIGATFLILIAGYVILLGLWPFDKIPVIALVIPWFGALPAGWWVRNKLWPRGALAGRAATENQTLTLRPAKSARRSCNQKLRASTAPDKSSA